MLESLQNLLSKHFPEVEIILLENSTPGGFQISGENIYSICELLHANENCYFDHLASIAGIDNGVDANTMEIIYTLYSIPRDQHLTLKVVLSRENPEVPTVSDIWQAANWHERETYDLYGIQFTNHNDLRRILLPADWIGFPMRKDYEEAPNYHGMAIKHPDKLKE